VRKLQDRFARPGVLISLSGIRLDGAPVPLEIRGRIEAATRLQRGSNEKLRWNLFPDPFCPHQSEQKKIKL